MVSQKMNKDEPEEQELYETDECKVSVKRDGTISVKCDKKIDEFSLAEMELRFIHGISEMAKSLEEKKINEKTTDDGVSSH